MSTESLSFAQEKYKNIEFLGRGGFGRAFKAERANEGDIVAVKEINLKELCKKKSSEQREKYRQMAEKEFAVMEKLQHPNIVRALEFYHSGDYIHIVMEFCDSESLGDAIDARRGHYFPESIVWLWAAQLARALCYLHANKVLHRDVKADNVFISCGFYLKLGDFGVAKELEYTGQSAKTGWGTISHEAPELFDDASFDEKSEVWAYGVVFYHIATLRLPFNRKSTANLIKAIQQDEPSTKITKRYSSNVSKLGRWLLEKQPKNRPTFAQVLEEPKVQAALEEMAHQGAGMVLANNLNDENDLESETDETITDSGSEFSDLSAMGDVSTTDEDDAPADRKGNRKPAVVAKKTR